MLESGEYASIREIANAEKINETYVGRVLRLTLLAPEIVEAVLNCKQLPHVSLLALIRPFPAAWRNQLKEISAQAKSDSQSPSLESCRSTIELRPHSHLFSRLGTNWVPHSCDGCGCEFGGN
jgi:hypothetical protein